MITCSGGRSDRTGRRSATSSSAVLSAVGQANDEISDPARLAIWNRRYTLCRLGQ